MSEICIIKCPRRMYSFGVKLNSTNSISDNAMFIFLLVYEYVNTILIIFTKASSKYR